MIDPTIVVGLGGQGSAIALGVKRRLEYFARSRQNPEAELEAVRRMVRIYSLDVDGTEDLHGQFPAAFKHKMTPANPDGIIKQLDQDQTLLKEWWPDHLVHPGAFDAGSGGIRAKGRLAYYLSGHDLTNRITVTIDQVRSLAAESGASVSAGGAIPVYVYIVGSLSGGTGSGSLLTMAMDLRSRVDDNVRIVGAIPLGSIMKYGPGNFMTHNIFANTYAGLRELEWWLTPSRWRPRDISPFFETGGLRQVRSDIEPFDFCYLFTERNRGGAPLGSFKEYTEFIADCVALDINSPAGEAISSLNSNIYGQTLQKVAPPPEHGEPTKPIVFASAGAASIEFSVRLTAEYLADRLLIETLDQNLLRSSVLTGDARKWFINEGVLGDTNNPEPMHTKLVMPYTDTQTNTSYQVGRPRLQLDQVPRSSWESEIRRRIELFERETLSIVERVTNWNSERVSAEILEALNQHIETLLEDASGQGIVIAGDWLHEARNLLNSRLGAISIELYADDANLESIATRAGNLRGNLAAALEPVRKARSRIPGLGKSDDEVQRAFESSWWRPFVEWSIQLKVYQAEQACLHRILERVETLKNAFDALRNELHRIRDVRRNNLGSYFSQSVGPMAKEDRVLGSDWLVDEVFGMSYAEQYRQLSARVAESLAANGTGLRQWLMAPRNTPNVTARDMTGMQEHLSASIQTSLRDVTNRFVQIVEPMSLWDAMEQEYYIRVETGKLDTLLEGVQIVDKGQGLRKYLSDRISRCLQSALAQWELDTARLGHYGRMYEVGSTGMVVFSTEPFNSREASSAVREVRDTISGLIGSHFSTHTTGQSPHQFLATQREWGAPLLLLGAGERDSMEQGERNYTAKYGHVYIDQRYVDVLPRSFDLESLADVWDKVKAQEAQAITAAKVAQQQEAVTLALAVQLGYVRKIPGATTPDGLPYLEFTATHSKRTYQQLAPGFKAALNRMKQESHLGEGLRKLVEESLNSASVSERHDAINGAFEWIDADLAEAAFDPQLTDPLKQMQEALASYQVQVGA